MVSKVKERIYAEAAATLLNADWLLVDIPEPLDFEVRSAEEEFGLEVRQVFVDAEATFGSPSKRRESKNVQAVSALAKRYYASGGSPISAKFLGAISIVEVQALVDSIVTAAPTYPGPNATIETQGVQVFMTPLPASWSDYSRWVFVNDRVGWLKRTTTADLQHAVDRKQINLPLYKRKYENIDLLLVADRSFNSGKLIDADHLAVSNPGFRAIYFMSYPESIQRVG
jgi:hypothetical protein